MAAGPARRTHDWQPGERAALALRLLRGEISAREAAEEYALSPDEIEAVKSEFLATAEQALVTGGGGRRAPAAEAVGTGGEASCEDREAVGVWVCALEPQSVTPLLFMRAACSDQPPTEVSVAWGGDGEPPKSFRKVGVVSILSTTCDRLGAGEKRLQLFSAKVPDRGPLERQTVISDWRLPVPARAALILLEWRDRGVRPRLAPRDLGSAARRTLAWVLKQHLPLVVAAIGCGWGEGGEDSLRTMLELPAFASVVPGPALSRRVPSGEPRKGSDAGGGGGSSSAGGSVWALLGGGPLRFDPAYAGRLLGELDRQIEPQDSHHMSGE